MAKLVSLPLLLVHWMVESIQSVLGVLVTWLLWRLAWLLLNKVRYNLMCLLCLLINSLCLSILDLAPSLASLPAPIVVRWPHLLIVSYLLLASFHSLVLLPPSAVLCYSTLDKYSRG